MSEAKKTKYSGTQTEQNLLAAFAGESQARNKYTYFASKAKKATAQQSVEALSARMSGEFGSTAVFEQYNAVLDASDATCMADFMVNSAVYYTTLEQVRQGLVSADNSNMGLPAQLVKEVATNDVVYADHYVNTIEVKQQEYVLEMLDQVIEYCKKNRVDLLEIEKLVRTRYPKEWNVIMEDFGYYLENLSYQYDVNSQTAGSYLVTN